MVNMRRAADDAGCEEAAHHDGKQQLMAEGALLVNVRQATEDAGHEGAVTVSAASCSQQSMFQGS
eukprot:scaffold60564_cov15-Tisochrysis_lutea.AAC.1